MKRKFLTIAGMVKAELSKGTLHEVPSVRQIEARYRISHQTAWKVMHALADKGAIAIAPGKRSISLAGPGCEACSATALMSASDRFAALVRQRISDGIYKVGTRLPKSGYFTITEKVSPDTVLRALLILREQAVVHKKQRYWVAGPAPAKRLTVSRREEDQPTVLLLSYKPREWKGLFNASHTAAFMLPFRNELSAFGHAMRPVIDSSLAHQETDLTMDWADILTAIRKLGPRYQGTLIQCLTPDQDYLSKQVGELCRLGKPVVYFDHTDGGPLVSRKRPGITQLYYRMFFDEMSAVREAVGALVQLGHREIGIFESGSSAWARNRASLVQRYATSEDPDLNITISKDTLDLPGGAHLSDIIRRLREKEIRQENAFRDLSEKARRNIRAHARPFVRFLAAGNITALCALCDSMAWEYHVFFEALGISVPRDISIISFDNEPSSIFFPISTVDFGFTRLGYMAAHVFIGDIPVQAARDGSVASVASLMDRGSIGRPGDGKALRRALA